VKKHAIALTLTAAAAILSGCVALRADSDEKGASVYAVGWGADSATQLANVAVTGPGADTATGVSFDSGHSTQQTTQVLQSLISLGAALAPVLRASAPAVSAERDADTQAVPADPSSALTDDTQTAYSLDGYGGSPGASGAGVYGRPSCSRCRAYRTAHPDSEIINVDAAANASAMWAALRARGFAASSVSLPVSVEADSYTQPAK
jgi:hypothetical protein